VLRIAAKVQVVTVPFQSGAPALNALLGKHLDIVAGPNSEFVPHIRQGVLRGLAVTGAKRHEALPDVPTLSEAGFPGLEIQGWIGVLAPAKTPDDISAKINAAVNAAVGKPAVNARLRTLGYGPNQMPLAETGPFLKNSIESWGKMIRATGISVE
jgi:tripartite-type tricarboxylate transporter receptor subunit TctC